MSKLIIQNVYQPSFISLITDNEDIDLFERFEEIENIGLNSLDEMWVNVGPGSFTGIRISIALVLPFFLQNRMAKVYRFTTYDILKFLISGKEYTHFVIRSWPRNRSVAFSINKGYFMSLQDGKIGTIDFKDFVNMDKYPSIAVLSDKDIDISDSYQNIDVYRFNLEKDTIKNFYQFLDVHKRNYLIGDIDQLNPIYINPVHITAKRDYDEKRDIK